MTDEEVKTQSVQAESDSAEGKPAESVAAADGTVPAGTPAIGAAMKYGDFESDVDYTTVLDDFEGPLDLLLHLINIAQINIEDVFVSKVTEQFLDYIEYMKTQPSRDVDKESEYLQIAAQIIYIKSKSMLPPVDMPEEEDADLMNSLDQMLRWDFVDVYCYTFNPTFWDVSFYSQNPVHSTYMSYWMDMENKLFTLQE